MEKVYKFYKYVKKDGFSAAFKKAARFFAKKMRITRSSLDVMVDVKDVIKADFINRPYKAPRQKDDRVNMRISWILSPVSPGSGGQNTIVRFSRFLQERGHNVTFYIYEGVQPQSVAEAKKILLNDFNFNVDVKSINDYQESDVVFATGWETAYPLFNLVTDAYKFYFIQDFEPFFYGLGSKSILAENTYKMGFYGVTAGKWLAQKVSKEYGMKADYFDFGADLSIYSPKDSIKKKKKIVFYARPVTERRAFELGVIALDIFHQKHPEYTIEFVGWDVSDYDIPFPYVNRGILTHEELAVLYQESIACLVLSLTNVSLLPLELLAAGCVPVMNDGENNRLVLGENKSIVYSQASPIELASALSSAVEVSNVDDAASRAINSVKSVDWRTSYEKVEAIIRREILKK